MRPIDLKKSTNNRALKNDSSIPVMQCKLDITKD